MPEPGDNSGGEKRLRPGPIPERLGSPPSLPSPPEREPMTTVTMTGVKNAKKVKKGAKPKPYSSQPVPVIDDVMDESFLPASPPWFYQSIRQPNNHRSLPHRTFSPLSSPNGVQPAIGQSTTPALTSPRPTYHRSPGSMFDSIEIEIVGCTVSPRRSVIYDVPSPTWDDTDVA